MTPKLNELKGIFESQDAHMEWERTTVELANSVNKKLGDMLSPAIGDRTDWIRCGIQRKIVERLENHDIVKQYNALIKQRF